MQYLGKSRMCRGHSRYKGPGVGMCLVYSRNKSEASRRRMNECAVRMEGGCGRLEW